MDESVNPKAKTNHLKYLKLLVKPVQLMTLIKKESSTETFTLVFLWTGLLLALINVFLPTNLYQSINHIDQTLIESLANIAKVPYEVAEKFLDAKAMRFLSVLLEFVSVKFFTAVMPVVLIWLTLWVATKKRKYPANIGEVTNVYLIALIPLWLLDLATLLVQIATGNAVFFASTSLIHNLWVIANPFYLAYLVLIGVGIFKAFDINKKLAVIIPLIMFFVHLT